MAQKPVRRLQQDFVCSRITDDGSEAEVPRVVGASRLMLTTRAHTPLLKRLIAGESTAQLVQAQIPVDPALATGVEVRNDVHAIALPRLIRERKHPKD